MQILKYFLLVILIQLLSGCNDFERMKNHVQKAYDNINPEGDRAVCLLLLYVDGYPYTTKVLDADSDKLQLLANEKVKKRLKGFAELGLLTEVRAGEAQGTLLYRYDLTEKGLVYNRLYDGWPAFCFGKKMVLNILDEQIIKANIGGTIKRVTVQFRMENVPEWAKSQILEKNYPNLPYLNSETMLTSADFKKNRAGEWVMPYVVGGGMY